MSQREKRRRPTIEDAATVISSLSTKIQVLTDVQVVRKKKLIITAHTFLKQRHGNPTWVTITFVGYWQSQLQELLARLKKSRALSGGNDGFDVIYEATPLAAEAPNSSSQRLAALETSKDHLVGPRAKRGRVKT